MNAVVSPVSTTFTAMGTDITVRVEHREAGDLLVEARDLFENWEAVLSRFRPDSELSRLNARAGSAVPVSPLLLRVIVAALRAAWATKGLFDPALGRQLVAAGYAQSFERSSPSHFRIARARPGGAWRDIVIDVDAATVRVPVGAAVDLGGIAKGMAVDALIDLFAAAGVTRAMVNAGGDLRVITSGDTGWPVGLTDVRGAFLTLVDGALATSSTARRRWRLAGEDQHHLIDPRTGEPSRSAVWSASVAAATCMQAEVAAKTALILGPDAGAAFLEKAGLSAILSRIDKPPIPVGAWPEHRLAA